MRYWPSIPWLEPMHECVATLDTNKTRGVDGFSLYDRALWLVKT